MIQPVNSLAWESEKIPWKTRRVVKDHLGHQGLPKAAKTVTQRSTQTSTLPQQSKKTLPMWGGLTSCNVTQEQNRRVAAVLANVMASLARHRILTP